MLVLLFLRLLCNYARYYVYGLQFWGSHLTMEIPGIVPSENSDAGSGRRVDIIRSAGMPSIYNVFSKLKWRGRKYSLGLGKGWQGSYCLSFALPVKAGFN